MASHFEDASQWRLRTNGGIPYKLLGVDGSLEEVRGTASLSIAIRGSDLLAFGEEFFPPPMEYGLITIPQYATFSDTALRVCRVNFKSFDTGVPIDPLGFDLSAPFGTYYNILRCDLELATVQYGSQNPADPITFLEVSSDTSAQILHSPATKMKIQPVREADAVPAGIGGITGGVLHAVESHGAPTTNRNSLIPHTMIVPETTWSVVWRKIPLSVFRDTIRFRLARTIGKINSKSFKILYSAIPETILFIGYGYTYSYTWKNGNTDRPFIDLTMKFLEKRVERNGKVYGHQDVFDPEQGWIRLLTNGEPSFETVDFTELYKA